MPDIPISWGELIDKITILEIKHERLTNPEALSNVNRELSLLREILQQIGAAPDELETVIDELKEVNEALWEIEDDIRDCERQKDFGDDFIRLARSVYHTNDERAALKKRINILLKSDLVEEKGYAAY